MDEYLRPTYFIDSDHPAVADFARKASAGGGDDIARAVRLYDAVRDGIRYDPYTATMDRDIFKASYTLEHGVSFCVPKAILLAAAARAEGIPSRLGFADVRNHLATARFLEIMRSDLFVFHGFTELYLEGKWVKATPTFNRALCDRFGVETLEFDGRSDACFHPYDRDGKLFMEYVTDRGTHADLPLEEMARALHEHYPHLFGPNGEFRFDPRGNGDFEAEAAGER
jgi:transglutaminase-like putative cysteine protease